MIILAIFLLFSVVGKSQVDFKISIENRNIGFFDPIKFRASLRYSGPDTTFYPISGTFTRQVSNNKRAPRAGPDFQYRHIDSAEWISLEYSIITNYSHFLTGIHSVEMLPSKYFENVDKEIYYYPSSSKNQSYKNQYAFSEPGTYICRLSVFAFYSDTVGIVSSVDTLFVSKYCRKDRKIIKKLLKMENSRFVFYHLSNRVLGADREIVTFPSMVTEVLSWKSSSIYADYARWNIIDALIIRRMFRNDYKYSFLDLRNMQLEVLRKTKHAEIKDIFSAMPIEETEELEKRLPPYIID